MSALTIVRELRPQAFGSSAPRRVRDPIVEPMWPGVRVLAAFDRSGTPDTHLADERGESVGGHKAIEAALASAARADTLIVDGYLTKQVGHDGSGVYTGAEVQVSTGKLVVQGMLGSRRDRAAETAERVERNQEARSFGPTDVVALVAIDLIWLDDEPLFDVPLLERKRLLEAALDESDVIRRGMFVRPPIETWIGSWRALGFSGVTFKAANGRYRPGGQGRRLDDRVDAAPLTARAAGRGPGWYGGLVPQTALTPAIRDVITRLGRADIMVGIPSFKNAATIGYVVRAAQAGLVQYFPDLHPVVVNSDAGSPDGTGRVVVETEPPDYVEQILLVRPSHKLERVSLTYPEIDGVGGKGAALRTIFEIAAALEVQALVVVDSDLRSIVPEWIELLAGPILKGGYDFVAPLYARYKYDGTITNTVTYPLTRALYGHRIRQPIGGDFGVSGDLVKHYLELDDWTPEISKFGIDIWMTTSAITGGFAVCQTRLGAKIHDPKDPGSDLGPMFRQVVGTILRLADRYADHWLPIHGSHDVPAYGFERIIEPPPLEVNTLRLLSEFHAGSLTLADTWRTMLAPATVETVLELAAEAGTLADAARTKLGIGGDVSSTTASTVEMAEAVSSFHFPDDLWARVIYDLVVTARDVIAATTPGPSLETLVAALVPIYFGRVGSFIIENRHVPTDGAEERVERQARAFELLKPYLVERWEAAAR